MGWIFLSYLLFLFVVEMIRNPVPKWEGSGVPRHGDGPASGDTGADMSQAAMFMNMDE